MKTTSAKFTVSELARMMGKPPKEVLFLLQGIGVDVKSADSVLDPGTAQAILTGKTQAGKVLAGDKSDHLWTVGGDLRHDRFIEALALAGEGRNEIPQRSINQL